MCRASFGGTSAKHLKTGKTCNGMGCVRSSAPPTPPLRCWTISYSHAPAPRARAAVAFPAGVLEPQSQRPGGRTASPRLPSVGRRLARECRARRASGRPARHCRFDLPRSPRSRSNEFPRLALLRGTALSARAPRRRRHANEPRAQARPSRRRLLEQPRILPPPRSAILTKPPSATTRRCNSNQTPPTRNNFGVALQAQGALSEAVEQYRPAIASNPALVDAHLNLGTALGKLGSFAEALACYRDALQLDANSAEAHFNAGNAHNALGELRGGGCQFRTCALAAAGLRRSAHQSGQRDRQARRLCGRGVALSPRGCTGAESDQPRVPGPLARRTQDGSTKRRRSIATRSRAIRTTPTRIRTWRDCCSSAAITSKAGLVRAALAQERLRRAGIAGRGGMARRTTEGAAFADHQRTGFRRSLPVPALRARAARTRRDRVSFACEPLLRLVQRMPGVHHCVRQQAG